MFDFPKVDGRVLLRCEGLDTLCDLYLHDTHVAYTDNMHRVYEFDVTDLLKAGENTITATFYSPDKYIKALHAKEKLRAPGDALAGFNYIRKASCMMGWDWGPRLPDAGIWKDICLVIVDSDRLTDVHILQRHEDVVVPALSSVWLENIDFQKADVQNNYSSFAFEIGGETVSEGTVLFTAPKHYNFQDPHLRCEVSGDEVTVYANCYAKWVEIYSPDSDFVLSDNYFDINGGSKTVKVLSGTVKTIALRSVYDVK